MSEETTPQTPGAETPEAKPARAAKPNAEAEGEAKPAKAPKKEKAPALEDKPFPEFINQDFIPALTQTLTKVGVSDLKIKFEQQPLPSVGADNTKYWQVIGQLQGGKRQFHIIFSKEDIQAPKYFSYADSGSDPSTVESFMIDERKVNLDLLLLYAVQRLNGQKWLVKN